MRFTKLATMTAVVAAMFIGAAGTGSAVEGQPLVPRGGVNINETRDVSAQKTDGEVFMEINNQGNLMFWSRSGETFTGQQRGNGWQNTRLITSLSRDRFLEINGANDLVLWTWTGSHYTPKVVGTNWGPARLVTGIHSHAFLEINDQGQLRNWYFNDNYDILGYEQIGSDWHKTRAIAGKDFVDFVEIKGDNSVSEWFDWNNAGHSLQEIQFTGADFSNVRLIIGTDFYHFVTVREDGLLVEYTLGSDGYYYEGLRGNGWGNARLIG
ncbi:hypothetical protein SAMN05661093_03558 [Kibdelosporangium aridum]|uniref:Bulb-type lectin domain-containing protein n=2 Tax=Kibdelosporangium aridum TaxID=2030 RepID=A0A1W2DNJ2_KIBAR|nr:hypothetical protein SAMN05661093_03558 [Kibdelosporangium aridum]